MRHRNLFLGVVSMCVLGAASMLQAAPLLTVSLSLTDTNGNAVAPNAVTVGQVYNVTANVALTGGNNTDAFRSAAVNNKPLGIQNVVVNLTTPGTVNRFQPIGDGGGPPPAWVGYSDLTPDGVSPTAPNLLDQDGDTDEDVAGAGFNISTFSLATNATAAALAKLQYGVVAMDMFVGQYSAVTAGPALLRAVGLLANIYSDPTNIATDSAASKAALQAVGVDIQTGFLALDLSLQVQPNGPVPEPASMALAAMAGFGVLARRRRA